MKYEWKTQLGPLIAHHWQQNHPEGYKALVRAKMLERAADKAADSAIALLADTLLKHRDKLSYQQAEEMAFVEWDRPPEVPTRKPATSATNDRSLLHQELKP